MMNVLFPTVPLPQQSLNHQSLIPTPMANPSMPYPQAIFPNYMPGPSQQLFAGSNSLPINYYDPSLTNTFNNFNQYLNYPSFIPNSNSYMPVPKQVVHYPGKSVTSSDIIQVPDSGPAGTPLQSTTCTKTNHSSDEKMVENQPFYYSTSQISNKSRKRALSTISQFDFIKSLMNFVKEFDINVCHPESGLFIIASAAIFIRYAILLFPHSISMDDSIKATFFNCLADKMSVTTNVIIAQIIKFVDSHIDEIEFKKTISDEDEDDDDENQSQRIEKLLAVHIDDIKRDTISSVTIPFLFRNLPRIFPTYDIVLFAHKNKEVAATYYPSSIENLRKHDFTKNNTIAILHYRNKYKLLQPLNPTYAFIDDTDDD
jgi:hypothetical protein